MVSCNATEVAPMRFQDAISKKRFPDATIYTAIVQEENGMDLAIASI
jgi:hypothetical protein